ncbi:NAD(P)H-binding protein [Cohaesibacter haloalkalitolerans]|uniref:NAD(P)H-binding protein n=1 Tax=Cohaesibacter haloalkalitolerans TaxID=1162980 RepID=UPI000E65C2EB|nr:NAD(P)H-binding protein [Cohaesibacter haloalkalitolerans]
MSKSGEQRTALVLGATGGVGGAVARALLAHGWRVRTLVREGSRHRDRLSPGVEARTGDAMWADDVVAAAEGASVLFHGVNPSGYQNWDKLVLPMIDHSIAAARAVGARIILPGTIYNFDPATTPVVACGTAQTGTTRKGKVRIELERRLRDASHDVPVLIVRAGDFFGPDARSSWLCQGMIKPGRPLDKIVRVARGGGHSWAYLPDLAEAIAQLANRGDALSMFEDLVFGGVYDETGDLLVSGIQRVVGKQLPVRMFPWWLMHLGAPFVSFLREVSEVEPFWQHPMRMDNARLVAILKEEPHTELDEALRATLHSLGCL